MPKPLRGHLNYLRHRSLFLGGFLSKNCDPALCSSPCKIRQDPKKLVWLQASNLVLHCAAKSHAPMPNESDTATRSLPYCNASEASDSFWIVQGTAARPYLSAPCARPGFAAAAAHTVNYTPHTLVTRHTSDLSNRLQQGKPTDADNNHAAEALKETQSTTTTCRVHTWFLVTKTDYTTSFS